MQMLQTNVNTIHAKLADSQLGFKECISHITDSSLKQKFESIVVKRGEMMRELEIRGGATKGNSGSVIGTLSRTWNSIKLNFSSGQQHILDDIVKEELALKKTYDDALKSEGVSSALNGLLMEHINKIDFDLSELRGVCGESKQWSTTSGEKTMGEKVKDKLGFGDTHHNQTVETHQTVGEKVKDKLGFGDTTHQQKVDPTVHQVHQGEGHVNYI
eukprot:TRINITY_DN1741_c0_g1_i1.p1 TRINITY_DN1741_c0_g1~~TRINITY_DN1741_c0_g1_i1.p1  ORF type:complete len:215 (+),score=33.88 TRINITY_DN1741_c0_g1_i1:122-766(+)